MRPRIRVAILMGGPSPERDVSLGSGRRVLTALDPERYEALPIEVTREGRWMLAAGAGQRAFPAGEPSGPTVPADPPDLTTPRDPTVPDPAAGALVGRRDGAIGIDRVMREGPIDVALIAMHGPYGEDGTVQGLLELASVPYVGSGVLASALAMDKLRTRQLLGFNDIPVPAYLSVTRERYAQEPDAVHAEVRAMLDYPCVVKPNAVGSSIGVTIVHRPAALAPAIDLAFRYGPMALIEEHIQGTEITCGVLENPETGRAEALPLIEIVPRTGFFDYQAKYTPGAAEEICPARLPAEIAARAQGMAVRSHLVLGCRDMSRVDMFVRGTQVIVLEVNTIPGLTEGSLLPRAARAAGIDFGALIDRLITLALRRRPHAG